LGAISVGVEKAVEQIRPPDLVCKEEKVTDTSKALNIFSFIIPAQRQPKGKKYLSPD
jgi:hypothetical protein